MDFIGRLHQGSAGATMLRSSTTSSLGPSGSGDDGSSANDEERIELFVSDLRFV
jgi:hypothetical protein